MTPAGNPNSTSPAVPAASDAGSADLSGQTLGDFKILRRLGQGGMGQVYVAEQISLKRKVALKVLKPELAANATALARFKLEAEAVARATHANIVQVYAIDHVGDIHFMALEYVEGRNLRQYLERKGPPEVLVALSIIRQVAAALQRASELGIIHRDIKPENILLTRKTEVKVADFGLSRCFADTDQPLHITQSGVTMGTPLYMSPEQVEGKAVDPRTDIYSFGVTCYHMLAGQPPYRGKSAFEVAVQHVQSNPPALVQVRPDLPPELCALVHKMMAKKPEDRFQTGREIVREVGRLRDALVGVTGGAPPIVMPLGPGNPTEALDAATTQPVPALRRRSWRPAAALLSIVLALGGGLGYGWWQNRGQAPAAPPAPPPAAGVEDAPAVKSLFSNREREKALQEAVKLHAQPRSTQETRRGLEDRIDLAVLYLKERRLDEAEAFFTQLAAQENVKSYRMLGDMGHALVLAFRNEPKKSNFLLMRLHKERVAEKGSPEMQLLWLRSEPLREILAEALHFNHTNLPGVFPKVLEKYRHAPPPKLNLTK